MKQKPCHCPDGTKCPALNQRWAYKAFQGWQCLLDESAPFGSGYFGPLKNIPRICPLSYMAHRMRYSEDWRKVVTRALFDKRNEDLHKRYPGEHTGRDEIREYLAVRRLLGTTARFWKGLRCEGVRCARLRPPRRHPSAYWSPKKSTPTQEDK